MTPRFLAAMVGAGLLAAQAPTLDSARTLLEKGSRGQAIRALEQIVQANPRDAEARLLLGTVLAEDGKRSEAFAQLLEAVRLRPDSAAAHNALGEASNSFGEKQAARGEFEKAVQLDPEFAPAQVNLGRVLVEAGELEASALHLDRALRILGNTPDAAYPHYLRAKVYTEQNDPEKAAAELKAAVALRPDFAEAWSDLGQARKSLNDDAGALAAFQRAVRLNPEGSVAQYRLGAEYLGQGKAHLAVAHLRIADRLKPDSQATLYALQNALRADGQASEADRVKERLARLLRRIDTVSQNQFTALRLNNEGAELEKQGDLRGALEKYRAALELDPDHVGIRVNYAVALLRLGQWTPGLAELREAVRRDPNNPVLKAALDDALSQAPPGAKD